jgi:hypothetical protein
MSQVKELPKRYLGLHAVDRLSLETEVGAFFGLLGPRGQALERTLARSLSLLELDLASDRRLVTCSRGTLQRIGLGIDRKAGVLRLLVLALGLTLACGIVLSALATESFQHRDFSGRSCASQVLASNKTGRWAGL